MKNILVPCDFSSPAKAAFQFALDVARKTKATIHVINVIELPVMHDTVLMPVLNFEAALIEELKQKTSEEFAKLKAEYDTGPVKVVLRQEFGIPSKEILGYIDIAHMDLVVMGSHGATGLREVFIGSNAEKIVRRSTVPVIVVKSYTDGAIKNIVFPNTLETQHQQDLVNRVKALQQLFDAQLHIVYINTPLNFVSDEITYARLEKFAEKFAFENYTLNIYNHPDEEEGITKFTKKVGGDLVAIATHGRKGLGHLIAGSLAEDLVNHTDKLIWTYSLKNIEVEA